MAINTFGSNLRVETNWNGELRDNDEVVKERNHLEHTHTENVPWSQSYQEPTPTPVPDDPQLREAVTKDLRTRNLKINNDHS